MLIKSYIVDDEPLAVKLLESYVAKTPNMELVGSTTSSIKAMQDIAEKEIDLLFLDIEMPELNGIELCKLIPKSVKVIFTTAYTQYAVESYRLNALDYLLKPISYSNFISAANKFRREEPEGLSKKMPQGDTIFIKSESKYKRVSIKDILYIEGLKDYIKIYMVNQSPIVSLMTMKYAEEMLSRNNFMRVHRSYIVNLDNVNLVERNRIVFGKEYIPISDTYKDKFMEILSLNNLTQ